MGTEREPGASQPLSGRQRCSVQRVRLFVRCGYTRFTGFQPNRSRRARHIKRSYAPPRQGEAGACVAVRGRVLQPLGLGLHAR